MPSMTHILILVVVVLLLTGKLSIPDLGRTLGKSARNFKKALKGEEDIDVTDTVKRIEED